MSFNSYFFVLVFFPLCTTVYFLLNKKGLYDLAKVWLICASFFFCGYARWQFAAILALSTIANWEFYILITQKEHKGASLAFAIIANCLFLGFFKYGGYFSPSFSLVLPLGISFYTISHISFLIEARERERERKKNLSHCSLNTYGFLDFTLSSVFFPKLIQGPITCASTLIPQFCDGKRKQLDWDNMAKGLTFFAFGLCKKVLIADKFALIANQGFSHIGETNTLTALLAIFSYTAQIYFDFSGYSDMAIGIASMLNIDLPINFNSPYKATSIGEFWRRWHISLTGFLTKDLYIPLGGNRKGKWRTCLNIMIVFLVSGIWHGAGLTFLVWGAIHGFASILSKVFRKYLDKLPRWIDWMLTMGIVCGAWIIFRSPDLHQAWRLVKHVLACNFEGGLELMEEVLTIRFFRYIIRIPIPSIRFAVYGIFDFLIPLYLVFFCKNSQEWIASHKPTMGGALFISCLLAVSLLSFTKVTTFVYAFF